MSTTDHTLTDAERAMFERIEDTGDTQGLTWRVQELLAARLATAEAEKEALRAESSIARMDAERYAGNLRYIAKHAYDGERCVWCGINIYDAAEDDPCVDHEPITYTTETKPEAAEAALAGLVAKIKALAGEWDEVANKWHYAVWHESQKANARDLRAIIPADATTALDAVKAQAAREALLAAADDYERERIERHEIVIAALDSKYDNGVVSGPAKFLRARADSITPEQGDAS